MLKFSLKTLFFFFLLFLTFGFVRWIDPLRQTNLEQTYLASLIDKHHRLDSLPAPRLILMGGSSMAFGTDSEWLEKKLGRPVQNMATQIVLGTKFMLNELQPYLRKGDIVLLGFEYHIASIGDYDQMLLAADFYAPAIDFIAFSTIKKYWTTQAQHQITRLKYLVGAMASGRTDLKPTINDTVSVFFRKGFSTRGDLLSHLNNPPQKPLMHSELPSDISTADLQHDLRTFLTFAQAKGVQVYYAFPPYARSAYQHNHLTIKRMEQELKAVQGITFIGIPEDFVFDDRLFFDSVYHLNAEGRQLRTEKLSSLWARYLGR